MTRLKFWESNTIPRTIEGPRTPEVTRTKRLVVMVGDEATRKTDLVRPYLATEMGERWIRTMGARPSKTTVEVVAPDGAKRVQVDIVVMDILGKISLLPLFKSSFFGGARGVLAVCDEKLPETFSNLKKWVDGVHSIVRGIPTFVLVRAEQPERPVFRREEIGKFVAENECGLAYVPLEQGEARNAVEGAFRWLATAMVTH